MHSSKCWLVVVRMNFDLIDRRHVRHSRQKGLKVRCAEVGHPDGTDAAFREQVLGGSVGVDGAVEVLWKRLVQQVQVDRVEPELSHADLEAVKRSVVPVVADPQLGLDEQLGPFDAAGRDGRAYLALIQVRGRRVNQAVADADGLLRRRLGDIGWSLEVPRTRVLAGRRRYSG